MAITLAHAGLLGTLWNIGYIEFSLYLIPNGFGEIIDLGTKFYILWECIYLSIKTIIKSSDCKPTKLDQGRFSRKEYL